MYVIGAGGHGKGVAEIFQLRGLQVRLLESDPARIGARILDCIGASEPETLSALRGSVDFFVAIGDADVRRRVSETWQQRGHQPATAIHPTAVLSPHAQLESGCCLMANAVVQVDCQIGPGTIINTGATVDHDCRLGEYVHIAPGAHLAGEVTVGEAGWIGIGSVVRERIRIGPSTLVGAGSVVTKDLPADVLAYGNPCRVVRTRSLADPPSA